MDEKGNKISKETKDLTAIIKLYSTVSSGNYSLELARKSLAKIYELGYSVDDLSRTFGIYHTVSKKRSAWVGLSVLAPHTEETLAAVKKTGKNLDDAITLIDSLKESVSFQDLASEVVKSLETKYDEEQKEMQGKCEHAFREDGKYCPRCGVLKSGLDSILAGEGDGELDEKSGEISLGSKIKTVLLAGAVVGGAYYALRNGC